ncbi:DNA/RNA polymerase, partial [Rhizophagus irregularis]
MGIGLEVGTLSRIILHVDMNSFYASVEQAYNPELKDKPIAIAGDPKQRRGIIVTSSYEARAKGIYTTMNVGEALRKCPDLPCSIGVAPNKFLAKTASDMKKPMGITILRKRDVPSILWPLPVIEMHGIGESTAKKLQTIKINTIGDLAQSNE